MFLPRGSSSLSPVSTLPLDSDSAWPTHHPDPQGRSKPPATYGSLKNSSTPMRSRTAPQTMRPPSGRAPQLRNHEYIHPLVAWSSPSLKTTSRNLPQPRGDLSSCFAEPGVPIDFPDRMPYFFNVRKLTMTCRVTTRPDFISSVAPVYPSRGNHFLQSPGRKYHLRDETITRPRQLVLDERGMRWSDPTGSWKHFVGQVERKATTSLAIRPSRSSGYINGGPNKVTVRRSGNS